MKVVAVRALKRKRGKTNAQGIRNRGGCSLAASFGLAAQKHQNDAFMQGPENEAQLAQEVRHQLLMLTFSLSP
jgi:hypothetical protein